MKYHKIRGIEKAVCTAEQMIAYNLAFQCDINYGRKYKKLECDFSRKDAIEDLISVAMRNYTQAYDYKPGKYDEDAIFAALQAGLFDYMNSPFIAWDYEQVGKSFPANYLK